MYIKVLSIACVCFVCFQTVFGAVDNNLNLGSRNICAIEVSSGRVLFAKNNKGKVKIASTTKIMTCILALENCSIDEMCTISKKAARYRWFCGGAKERDASISKIFAIWLNARERQ